VDRRSPKITEVRDADPPYWRVDFNYASSGIYHSEAAAREVVERIQELERVIMEIKRGSIG